MTRVLFLDGTTAFRPDMLGDSPVGGICTSLSIVPRGLASLGYEVFVFNVNIKEPVMRDGVHFIDRNYGKVDPDVVVYNRNFVAADWIDHWPNARHILWLHDIPAFNYLSEGVTQRIHTFVALSEYQKLSYKSFYSIPDERFVVIRNGYDPAVFYRGSYELRDRSLYIHASAPIKGGFESLICTYKGMKQRNLHFRLVSFCNQSLHGLDNTQYEERLKKMKIEGITVCGPIAQQKLADLMRKAWALLMPNSYPENCSNTMIQAQACGLPVVASAIGDCAYHDVSHGILKTETTPTDIFWHFKDFADRAIHLSENEKLHRYCSERGPRSVETWTQIVNKWSNLIGTAVSLSVKTAEPTDGGKTLTAGNDAAAADPTCCEFGG